MSEIVQRVQPLQRSIECEGVESTMVAAGSFGSRPSLEAALNEMVPKNFGWLQRKCGRAADRPAQLAAGRKRYVAPSSEMKLTLDPYGQTLSD